MPYPRWIARSEIKIFAFSFGTSAPWKTMAMRNGVDYEWMQDRMPFTIP